MATYDPSQVGMNFLGKDLDGWDEVEIDFITDRNTWEVSTDGRALRIVSLDKRAKITIRVPMDSPTNDILSAAFALDLISNAGMGPFGLAHFGGTTVASAGETCVSKMAATGFTNGKSQREWVLVTGRCDLFSGGIA